VTPGDYTLLVVDDSEDNRYTLTRRLAREGFTSVVTAADGRQALDLLQERRFDLVLLDIMMPELNGYEVLERIKADKRLRHIPVIMISAVDQIESVIRCIELGAEDYLPKPFNPTLLRARVGASLEKKRLRDEIIAHLGRIERELESAREIQLSMVPTNFPAPTEATPVELYATLQPALQVGGDLYDFFWRDAQTLCFVVADVSDKGAPAALFMARAKTLIRLVATLLRTPTGGAPGPDEIIARVNEELCRDNPHSMFVTLFFGMLDPASGELRFCNAGHTVPYLVSPGGTLVPLEGARAKPVGIRPTLSYQSATSKLAPGDYLFLFTDGITESMDGGGVLFSEQRLEGTLESLAGQTPRAIVETVIAKVREFAGAAPQSDDIAAMALRRVT
jgi:sigma-B regulation protein RsbU (phosphoserine phosphatase)